MRRWAVVDYTICEPKKCDPNGGTCISAMACRRRLIEQEESFGPPMLTARELCLGCYDCVRVCSLGALKMMEE